ncbi:hypothetical protein CO613_11340 [Lysobacteraceae bacterium NML07-0707]|nr:hypothetical protein CO613_11340 [Xanthomonadaceae bacterium NML07-0707]
MADGIADAENRNDCKPQSHVLHKAGQNLGVSQKINTCKQVSCAFHDQPIVLYIKFLLGKFFTTHPQGL